MCVIPIGILAGAAAMLFRHAAFPAMSGIYVTATAATAADGPGRPLLLQSCHEQEVMSLLTLLLLPLLLQVDLGEVYCGREAGRDLYCLRAMACYYGGHYQAFVLVPSLGRWVMFDDSKVSHVGSWADVRTKCGLGRIQPSVLFYEAAA